MPILNFWMWIALSWYGISLFLVQWFEWWKWLSGKSWSGCRTQTRTALLHSWHRPGSTWLWSVSGVFIQQIYAPLSCSFSMCVGVCVCTSCVCVCTCVRACGCVYEYECVHLHDKNQEIKIILDAFFSYFYIILCSRSAMYYSLYTQLTYSYWWHATFYFNI